MAEKHLPSFDWELDEIYKVVKRLPLYKRKSKEECFLGILKSQHKKWVGWKYLGHLKRNPKFDNIDFFIEVYELALNYHWIKESNLDYELLLKNYDF